MSNPLQRLFSVAGAAAFGAAKSGAVAGMPSPKKEKVEFCQNSGEMFKLGMQVGAVGATALASLCGAFVFGMMALTSAATWRKNGLFLAQSLTLALGTGLLARESISLFKNYTDLMNYLETDPSQMEQQSEKDKKWITYVQAINAYQTQAMGAKSNLSQLATNTTKAAKEMREAFLYKGLWFIKPVLEMLIAKEEFPKG